MVWNTSNTEVTRVRFGSHMRGIATTFRALNTHDFDTQVKQEK
jgi:hypothetical protein